MGSSLLRTLQHIDTFVHAADHLDVVLLRYEDLKRDLLDEADLARYWARARAIGPDDVVDWVHDEA